MQERAQLDRVRKMIYDQILQWTHVLLLTAKFTCITLGVALIDYMQESSMLSIEMRRLTFFFLLIFLMCPLMKNPVLDCAQRRQFSNDQLDK